MPLKLDTSLVPARRLGQLLVEHRATSKLTATEVARRSDFLSTPSRVSELESGLLALSDVEIEEVTDAYGVSLSTLVPQRTKLNLDLESLSLSLGRQKVSFARSAEATLNELLTQYLSTVRALRSLPDKAEVSLREADLRTLSTGLVLPSGDVRTRLQMLIDDRPDELRERAELMLGRPVIPALGVLVGGTGIGSLVLAPPNSPKTVAAQQVVPDLPDSGATISEGGASLDDINDIKQEVLDLISYDYRRFLPGWIVEFWPARSNRRGSTIEEDRRIEIYVREDQTPTDLAHAMAYQLGRAIDISYNDVRQRLQWLSAREIRSNCPWLNGDGRDDFTVGAGDFADSFAHWQSGGSHMMSELAGPPDGEQLDLLSEFSFGHSA